MRGFLLLDQWEPLIVPLRATFLPKGRKRLAMARPSSLMQHSRRLDGGGGAVFDTKLHIDLLKMLVHRAR